MRLVALAKLVASGLLYTKTALMNDQRRHTPCHTLYTQATAVRGGAEVLTSSSASSPPTFAKTYVDADVLLDSGLPGSLYTSS